MDSSEPHTNGNYLRTAQINLGLLIHFNVEFLRDGMHRKINEKLNQ